MPALAVQNTRTESYGPGIWIAGPQDVPWIAELAIRRYGPLSNGALQIEPRDYPLISQQFYKYVAMERGLIVLRSEQGFIVPNIQTNFWAPRDPYCYLMFPCTEPTPVNRAVVRLIQAGEAWAREQGCAYVVLGSENEVDFTPVAKPLGFEPMQPGFRKDLRDHG